MNKVLISGRIVKDIELKTTSNNVDIVSNTIAVRKDFKKEDGTYDSDFINIVAYRNNATFMDKYFNKGDNVIIEGRLNTRNYEDKDNKKVFVTELIVEKIEFAGSRTKKEENKEQKEVVEDPYSTFGEQLEINDQFLD